MGHNKPGTRGQKAGLLEQAWYITLDDLGTAAQGKYAGELMRVREGNTLKTTAGQKRNDSFYNDRGIKYWREGKGSSNQPR